MQKIYLISTDVLKSNSIICQNVDNSLLLNAIFEGQEIELQQTLGSALYNHILTLVDDGSISDTENARYKELLDDYIQNFVCYYALYHAIPVLAIKVKNKGLVRENSEWSQDSTFQEMSYLRSDVQNKAEFFAQRLTSYLESNKDSFPDYKACCSCCGDIPPNKNNYRCGLVLDEREYKRNYNILDITL